MRPGALAGPAHGSGGTAPMATVSMTVNGKAAKSCTVLALQCDGSQVTTIEGLANGSDLHPMQAAFREHHGLQCGYCAPGMIMAAVDIVPRKGAGFGPPPPPEE